MRERDDNLMRSTSRILELKETDTRKQVIFFYIFFVLIIPFIFHQKLFGREINK